MNYYEKTKRNVNRGRKMPIVNLKGGPRDGQSVDIRDGQSDIRFREDELMNLNPYYRRTWEVRYVIRGDLAIFVPDNASE